MSTDRDIHITVDSKSHRPGCVLIQAAFGTPESHDVVVDYSDIWLTAPTDNMVVLKGKESVARQMFDLVRWNMRSKELAKAKKKK